MKSHKWRQKYKIDLMKLGVSQITFSQILFAKYYFLNVHSITVLYFISNPLCPTYCESWI